MEEHLKEKGDKSKLIFSINRKKFESGLVYNSVVLILSNINIGQYCFSYMISKNGVGTMAILIIVIILIANLIQNALANSLLNNRNSEVSINYASITAGILNTHSAVFIEICLILWVICYISTTFLVTINLLNYFFTNNVLVYGLSLVVFLVFLICMTGFTKDHLLVNLIPYICVSIQIMTIVIYFIVGIYQLVHSEKSTESSVNIFSWDVDIYEAISIISSSINTVIYIFSITQQIDNNSSKKSDKMIKFSNLFLILFFIVQLFSVFISLGNGKIFPKFSLTIQPYESDKIQDAVLNQLKLVWLISNIVNQYLLSLFHYFTIKKYGVREETFNFFFKKSFNHSMSSFTIWFISCTIGYLMFYLSADAYYLIIISIGVIGFFLNYLFPVLIYSKLTKDNILSFSVIFRLGTVYLLGVFCFASLINNLLL